MEIKGLRVNAGKTKVMCCQESMSQIEGSGEHLFSLCRKRVSPNNLVTRVSQDVVKSYRVMLIYIREILGGKSSPSVSLKEYIVLCTHYVPILTAPGQVHL